MYPQERREEILAILEQHQYVTVAYLMERLRYSSATINRDLNALEKRQLVRRSYGGVELEESRAVPLVFRQHKQHHAKECIAQRAAAFVEDGDVLFIDGSTTAQHMGRYLAEKERLTVITNNITLAASLSDRGIECVVLGGRIVEQPSMTGGVADDGTIGSGDLYYELLRVMIHHADKAYFLIDKEKLNNRGHKVLCDFGAVDAVISDYDFSALAAIYPETQLIQVTV